MISFIYKTKIEAPEMNLVAPILQKDSMMLIDYLFQVSVFCLIDRKTSVLVPAL